jgi:hypothetical protein
MALFIHRAVRPASSSRKGARLGAPGEAGDMADFGLVCLVTAFMDNQS